jgi:hypothetical protein
MTITDRLARFAIITACLGLTAGSALGGEEAEKELPFEPGQILKFELDEGGSLFVVGWDKPVVRIGWTDKQGDIEDHRVEIGECRGGYEVVSEWAEGSRRNSHSLHFEVRIPWECDIEFRSAGGSLELIGLEGDFSGRTAGGEISISDCKGEARLTSGGGGIEVVDSEMDGRITTGGGPVLLKNIVGDLDATSGGGNVQYRNVRDREGRTRGPGGKPSKNYDSKTVLVFTAGGGIDIDEAPEGADVTTGGGDIRIANAAKFVHAKTGGGDIDIEVEGGTVTAGTGAGDVAVEISGGPAAQGKGIELSSGYGEITLVVPRGFSMDLDLTIVFTRNSSRDFDVLGDFDVDMDLSPEWDTSEGSPKKYLTGGGKFNGGKIPVEIRTTNGNIYIEEK